jgi:hypothetical protein
MPKTGSRTLAEQRRNCADHLRVRQRAVEAPNDRAFFIDDDGRRQAERRINAPILLLLIQQNRIMNVQRTRKIGNAVSRFSLIDADDDDVALAVGLIQALQVGHFCAARRAPRGPQIHDDDFAVIIVEPGLNARERTDREAGCRVAGQLRRSRQLRVHTAAKIERNHDRDDRYTGYPVQPIRAQLHQSPIRS